MKNFINSAMALYLIIGWHWVNGLWLRSSAAPSVLPHDANSARGSLHLTSFGVLPQGAVPCSGWCRPKKSERPTEGWPLRLSR